LCLLIFLSITNRPAFAKLGGLSLGLFLLIYCCVHIDLTHYVAYGIPLIIDFPDAMALEADPSGNELLWAVFGLTLFAGSVSLYLWQNWKQRRLSLPGLLPPLFLGRVCFLIYKNGFTRADIMHVPQYFMSLPFLMSYTLLLFGLGDNLAARLISITALAITAINVSFTPASKSAFVYNATIGATKTYFTTIFAEQQDEDPQNDDTIWTIPADKQKLIGNATIDIFPYYISIPLASGLNYTPRPVIQSYSAYSPALDSVTAAHFLKPATRPDYVMVWNSALDMKYGMWDVPATYAALHLNYEYADSIALSNDARQNSLMGIYFLLKSKSGPAVKPIFEKLTEKTVLMDQRVDVDFAPGEVVYMTAEIDYTPMGKILNLLHQPPTLSVSLFVDGGHATARVVRPILRSPVLISNTVLGNDEFKNFISGNIQNNHPVKAFLFHATGDRCKDEIRLTFYRFSNYL
jgi:hypothetical protein